MVNQDKTYRDLVSVAVEHALLQMGTLEFEKVEERLKNDYKCGIGDCLDHPEYLKRILCDLFGYCYTDILDAIDEVFKGAVIEGKLEEFVTVLKSK